MNSPKYSNEVLDAAIEEFDKEIFRGKVELLKSELREAAKNKRWWHRLIPFTIKIKRRK